MKRTASSILIFLVLLCGTILIDYIFHSLQLAMLGRYLGIVGSLLIVVSFLYSMKKWKLTRWGNAKKLLWLHEVLGWVGALFIMVHGGIHFNAVVPWIAVFSMVAVVASGLTGKYLLQQAKNSLQEKRTELKIAGKTEAEIDAEIEVMALMVSTMKQWRKVHMPLTMLFFATALVHIAATFLFWRW